MEKRKYRIFNRLYLQVSSIFLLVLLVFAAITLWISIRSARNYSVEVNQKLNWNLARNMVQVIKPEFRNGVVDQATLADILHSLMVINPSIEVYLLDPAGNILSYVAPEKVVKLHRVDMAPVSIFLKDQQHHLIYGTDPRNPGDKKTFSAAMVVENGRLTGYIYIVLASQEYISASQMVIGSYILGLSVRAVIIILAVSVLVGLLVIWFITNKLNKIIRGMEDFHSGNWKARIPVKHHNELDIIGRVFNDMADTLSRQIRELKETDEFRKELIGNVSHDLRTPVASIQGYAETLLLKKDALGDEDRHKYLQIIYSSCENLKKLVDELFELSKLQTNQVKLNPEPFSITELVSDVANKYRMLSQKKGISINTFIPREIPMVEADLLLIDRVLQNLIDNAMKFCREGDFINLQIGLEGPERVTISIADSGEGIRQDELPYIFERYYKGKKYSESTGLGLAIVKKIIDLHHTQIAVTSQPGKGTIFSFSLPIMHVA